MDNFQVLLIEGVFYERGGDIYVTMGGSEVSVVERLQSMVGQNIRFAMHHALPGVIDETKWGGGCCLWQPVPCPAWHHLNPAFLLNVSVEGVLRHAVLRHGGTDVWRIEQFNGINQDLPLAMLVGHYGRVAAASLVDVAKMRDQVFTSMDSAQVDALGVQAQDIKQVLQRLQQQMNGGQDKPK